MLSLKSSVLIVGHPSAKSLAFGADVAGTFAEARELLGAHNYPVVAFSCESATSQEILDFLSDLEKASVHTQKVVIEENAVPEALRMVINSGNVFKVIRGFSDDNFEITLQEALEEYDLNQQNTRLLQLVSEQNDRLRRLSADLEERVEKRQKFLEDARTRLVMTNQRVEALHRAFVAAQRAKSRAEMERLISSALQDALAIKWIRIVFEAHANLQHQTEKDEGVVHVSPLMRDEESLGIVYFSRGTTHPFSKDETAFLNQVADAVSLALDRLNKLDEMETLKLQWEATFDAVVEPVSLITPDYRLLRINKAFAEQSGIGSLESPGQLIGRKCYEALFGRTAPCDGCKLGAGFRLRPSAAKTGNTVVFEVFSQAAQLKRHSEEVFVNMYHEISSQLKLERQVVESAKMAELGTIGSSIAHELNNPLGGMLNFLQLIKMDLKGDESFYQDIVDMEAGTKRCAEIIKSLLGFTRKPASSAAGDTPGDVDLREALDQAVKITELQTRSLGIKVNCFLPVEVPLRIRGEHNQITQALRNFLQNANEAIAEKMRRGKRFQGEINVRVKKLPAEISIEISDNGVGIESEKLERVYDPLFTTKNPEQNPGLGLTVAQQIITEFGGKLDLASTLNEGTTARISFLDPL